MAKKKDDVSEEFHIPELFREEFIRVLKYGIAHIPFITPDFRALIEKWIGIEEEKINIAEGRMIEEELPSYDTSFADTEFYAEQEVE